MTGCDCEAFAHENCPTADATARTETRARKVALHGIQASEPPCDRDTDDDAQARRLASWDSLLGLYAESLRVGALSTDAMSTLLDGLPAPELRNLLLAAMTRLADTEDAR